MAMAASPSSRNCLDHRSRTSDDVSAREHARQAGCSLDLVTTIAPVIDLKQAVREAEVRHLPNGQKTHNQRRQSKWCSVSKDGLNRPSTSNTDVHLTSSMPETLPPVVSTRCGPQGREELHTLFQRLGDLLG